MDTPLDKKRRAELLWSVFGVLRAHPEGIRARDVLAEVERTLGLTDYERDNYPGTDIRRFEKTVRFQTITAVKAGWLVKQKGVWTITDAGQDAFTAHNDPEAFYDLAGNLYRDWEKARKREKPIADVLGEEDSDPRRMITTEKAEETAAEEIWDYLSTVNPYDFQEIVAGLLQGMGYHVDWVAPRGKDRGIDIVAFRDPLGAEGPRIKVQVKREQGKTDVKGLRAFLSVLSPNDLGVFVSLGGFTTDAEQEARASETRLITLIDRTRLLDLWTEHYTKIPEERRALLLLRPVYYLAPDADD